MKLATLTRYKTSPHGTFGRLEIDDLKLRTGELPDKGNAAGISCIPAGEYECRWARSPRFGEKYTLQNVPGRSHILIHSGNLCGDTTAGLKSDVEGCILLGYGVGLMGGQECVVTSKAAVDDFEAHMKREPFTLKVVDEYLETGKPATNVA